MKIAHLTAALAVAAGLALGAASQAHAAKELVVTMDTAPGHLRTRMMKEFLARLEKRSGGELTAKLYDSSQLYSSRDAAKAVARGDAGFTVLVTPYLSRISPDINVFDLPVLNGMSDEQRAAMLDRNLGDTLAAGLQQKMGVVVPGHFWSMGKVMIWSTAKPINRFADMKGMKVRIPGGAAVVMRMDAIEAAAVAMPGNDVPLALQQGVVDATMGGAEWVLTNKLIDAGIRHGFWDQGIIGYLMPILNKAYWAALNADQKELFTEVWNEVTDEQRQAILAEETEHWAQLNKIGISIVSAADDDVAQANQAMLKVQDQMIEKLGISEAVVRLAKEAVK
ncbi:MAG: TRAP transporter substrate-binding protein DctP [Burkholderiaceae bacterium]